jgi:hypothetical protein
MYVRKKKDLHTTLSQYYVHSSETTTQQAKCIQRQTITATVLKIECTSSDIDLTLQNQYHPTTDAACGRAKSS